MQYKHASLFSGIGGFDLAAQIVGFENKFHCEKHPFCLYTLKYYWPDAETYEDIKKTCFKKWKGLIDILTGGFPCQPYSGAGKRKGKGDDRHLWPEFLRAIREIQPRWVIGENVLGIVSWNRGLVFDEVCNDLEVEGYEVTPFILPACAVNAPHRRDRVFFIAYKNPDNDGRLRDQRQKKSGAWKQRNTGAGNNEQLSGDNGKVGHKILADTTTAGNRKTGSSSADERKQSSIIYKKKQGRSRQDILDSGHGNIQWDDTNTDNERPQGSKGKGGAKKKGQSDGYIAEHDSANEFSSNTISQRPQERTDGSNEGHTAENFTRPHNPFERFEYDGIYPYFGSERRKGSKRHRKHETKKIERRETLRRPVAELCSITDWQHFPTQSPVCSRDDGFPGKLVRVTVPSARGKGRRELSFRKLKERLRKESIAGYGNAVVVPLVVEIFNVIKEYEKQTA